MAYFGDLVTLNIMAYNDKLAGRIRVTLSHLPKVEEKKMFESLTFMAGNKMCITTSADRIMCRIEPGIHEEVIKKKGCLT